MLKPVGSDVYCLAAVGGNPVVLLCGPREGLLEYSAVLARAEELYDEL